MEEWVFVLVLALASLSPPCPCHCLPFPSPTFSSTCWQLPHMCSLASLPPALLPPSLPSLPLFSSLTACHACLPSLPLPACCLCSVPFSFLLPFSDLLPSLPYPTCHHPALCSLPMPPFFPGTLSWELLCVLPMVHTCLLTLWGGCCCCSRDLKNSPLQAAGRDRRPLVFKNGRLVEKNKIFVNFVVQQWRIITRSI